MEITHFKTIFKFFCSVDNNVLNILKFCNSPKNLWFLLDKHQTPPMIGEEAMINYENFLKVGEKAGPKCK